MLDDISLPAAVTVFYGEIYRAPRSWCERAYHKLIYFHEVDRGGHFAALGAAGPVHYRDAGGVPVPALAGHRRVTHTLPAIRHARGHRQGTPEP